MSRSNLSVGNNYTYMVYCNPKTVYQKISALGLVSNAMLIRKLANPSAHYTIQIFISIASNIHYHTIKRKKLLKNHITASLQQHLGNTPIEISSYSSPNFHPKSPNQPHYSATPLSRSGLPHNSLPTPRALLLFPNITTANVQTTTLLLLLSEKSRLKSTLGATLLAKISRGVRLPLRSAS